MASLQAAVVSASAAVVPGPLGLVSVVPDMLLFLRLQRQVVADTNPRLAEYLGQHHPSVLRDCRGIVLEPSAQ